METVFVVLNYYELPHYYLNVFGGFSICFIITLYLQSYIFQFCSWHRDMPKYMRKYLQNYGWHFNKALCSYAISFMKKGGKSLEPVSKEYIDKVLTQNNIKLENNVGYDYVFVGNMCKADYYGSSITDERHFALYIKDTIDDEDAGDGTTMRRWYATMVANGTMVDWEDVI